MPRCVDDRDYENRFPSDPIDDAVREATRENPPDAATPITDARQQGILKEFIEALLHREREFRSQSGSLLIVPRCRSGDIDRNLRPEFEPEAHRPNFSFNRALNSSNGMAD